MQSYRSSQPAASPLGSRAGRHREWLGARRHLPRVRLVPGDQLISDARSPSPGELVAEVTALIDTGMIEAVDSGEVVCYARVESNAVSSREAARIVKHEIVDHRRPVAPVHISADAKSGEL